MFCSATPTLKKRLGEALRERLEHRVAEVAGQQHDPLVLVGEIDERAYERPPHDTGPPARQPVDTRRRSSACSAT